MSKTDETATESTELMAAPSIEQLVEEQGWGLIPGVTLDKNGQGFVIKSTEELLPEITGSLINFHFTRSNWNQETGELDCYSRDGKTGTATATGEMRTCAGCPFLKDGCKLRSVLIVMPDDAYLPIRLFLPTASTFRARGVLQTMLARFGPKMHLKRVRIGSKTEQKGPNKYAVVTITPIEGEADAKSVNRAFYLLQLLNQRTAQAPEFAEVDASHDENTESGHDAA